jgi:hypothetical protein
MTTIGTYITKLRMVAVITTEYTPEGKVSITCYINNIDNKFVTRKCLYLKFKKNLSDTQFLSTFTRLPVIV